MLYPSLYPDACREGAVPRVERHLVWHCQLTANCYQLTRCQYSLMLARKVTSPTLSTEHSVGTAFAPKQDVKVAVAIYIHVHIVIKSVDALPRSDVTCLCIDYRLHVR